MSAPDLSRYCRPALHFSGGKDSMACLYLLRHELHRLPVYWVNAGDPCPETLAVIEAVREWVPHFVEIRSDAKAWRAQFGAPVDALPASGHFLGLAYGLGERHLSCRFDCCYHNLMLPMHQRMVADGVDAVIRGTKLADTGAIPAEGATGFYDVLLPLRDWSHSQVFDYLRQVGAPISAIYAHTAGASAPECLGCTAWWDDGKAAYLKARHPAAYTEYRATLVQVRDALRAHIEQLDTEIGG